MSERGLTWLAIIAADLVLWAIVIWAVLKFAGVIR